MLNKELSKGSFFVYLGIVLTVNLCDGWHDLLNSINRDDTAAISSRWFSQIDEIRLSHANG